MPASGSEGVEFAREHRLTRVMKNSKAWPRKHALQSEAARVHIAWLRQTKRNRVYRSHPILEDALSQVLLCPFGEEQI